MKPSMRKLLLDTFALFPDYHFIWRFTELNEQIEEDLKEYENVHAFKWLQQTSILGGFFGSWFDRSNAFQIYVNNVWIFVIDQI